MCKSDKGLNNEFDKLVNSSSNTVYKIHLHSFSTQEMEPIFFIIKNQFYLERTLHHSISVNLRYKIKRTPMIRQKNF